MKRKTTILIVVAGILVGVISSWFNEYNQLMAFGISIRLLLASASFVASFIVSLFFNERYRKISLLRIIHFNLSLESISGFCKKKGK